MFSGFSRRQILHLIGVFVSGTAAVGSIGLIRKLLVGAAQAQEATNISTYKGRTIRMTTNQAPQLQVAQINPKPYNEPVKLSIDDKRIDIIQDQTSGMYHTYLIPFKKYSSPTEAAKDIIDLRALGN